MFFIYSTYRRKLDTRWAYKVKELGTQILVLWSVQVRPELVPGGTIGYVLQHEVKELGTRILVLCRSGQSWCQGGLLITCYSTRWRSWALTSLSCAGAARAVAWLDYWSRATARGEGAGHSHPCTMQERPELVPREGLLITCYSTRWRSWALTSLSCAGAARAGTRRDYWSCATARGEGVGHSYPRLWCRLLVTNRWQT